MQHPDSNQHAGFVELVTDVTDDPHLGAFILTWLQAPPNLAYVAEILKRTATILNNESDRIKRLLPAIPNPGELAATLEQIAGQSDALRKIAGNDALLQIARVKQDRSSPHNHYCLTVAHYWSGLFYTPEWGDAADMAAYDRMFEQFSVLLWRETSKTDPSMFMQQTEDWRSKRADEDKKTFLPTLFDYQGRMGRAYYAVRLLTKSKFKPLFKWLTDDVHGAHLPSRVYTALEAGKGYWDQVADSVVEADQSSKPPRLWQRLNHLASLISVTVPDWKWPEDIKRRRSGPPKPGVTRRTSEGDGYVRLAETDWVIEQTVLDDGQELEVFQTAWGEAESIDDDPALDDYLNEPEILATRESVETAPNSLAVRGVKTVAQARQLAKYYLMMPHPYAVPTNREIELISKRLLAVRHGNIPAAVEHAVVCGALALGRPYSEIAKVHLCNSSETPTTQAEFLLDMGVWRITVRGPDLKDLESYPGYEDLNLENAMPISRIILLPDFAGFGQILSALGLSNGSEGPLISRFTKLQRHRIADWLASTLGGTRISVNALHKPMQRALVNQTDSDLAPMTMLTGLPHAHSLTTLHYSVYSAKHLRSAFQRASNAVLGELFIEPDAANGDETLFYGNHTQPTQAATRMLIEWFQARLEEADPNLDTARYNDYYVIYTVMLLTLGQARRPHVSPGFSDLTAKTGASTWIDKARSEAQRRGAYLPEILKTQLDYCLRHIQAMCGYSHAYRYLVNQGHRFVLCRPEEEELAQGGAFDPTPRARPFRPRDFRLVSQEVFGLPMYSLRRYVRMALILDYRVNGEIVDALMGHMRIGLSPFEPLITFPANQLREVAEGPLQQMLTDLGAKAIHSKLVAHG